MQRKILLNNQACSVTVSGSPGRQHVAIDEEVAKAATLTCLKNNSHLLQLGNLQADIKMVVKGETVHIKAFNRTLSLQIIDPVDQAAQETGTTSDCARAPMPGMVVETPVSEGEQVSKGQPIMTIESMKILTLITSPRDGNVAKIHFKPGDTFDKSAALVTLEQEEDS